MVDFPNNNFQGANMQIPAYAIPSDTDAANSYNNDDSGGDKLAFLRFPLPNGMPWANAPVNSESKVVVFVLPAPPTPQGQQPYGIFHKSFSHFYKSQEHPKGIPIICPGKATCLVCQSRSIALGSGNPELVTRAENWAKGRVNFLYQVVVLSDPTQHKADATGKMRPVILQAGTNLHTSIGNVIKTRGIGKIVDPRGGRPLLLTRTKTGFNTMDVDYAAIDMEPSALDPYWYGVLNNLYVLKDVVPMPTQEQMVTALREMQLPLPGGVTVSLMQMQAPQPAYGQGQQLAATTPGYPPVGTAIWSTNGVQPLDSEYKSSPNPTYAPVSMNAPVSAPIPNTLPPSYNALVGVGMPPPYQAPQMPSNQQPAAMPAYSIPGTTTQAPSPMNMPVVSAVPPAQPVYQSNGYAMTGVTNVTSPAPVSNDSPHLLSLPLNELLPGGKERCFSHFNNQDNMCAVCPDWIKQQCYSNTQQPVTQDTVFDNLEKQLLGQRQ